jgi:hypothetical protein
MSILKTGKEKIGRPIEKLLKIYCKIVWKFKKLFSHLQSKQTDKFFIVKV